MVKMRKVVEVEVEVDDAELYAQLRENLSLGGPSDRFELEKGDIIKISGLEDMQDMFDELSHEDGVPEAVVVSDVDYSDNTIQVGYLAPDGEYYETDWFDPEGYVLLDKYDRNKPAEVPAVAIGIVGQYEKTKW